MRMRGLRGEIAPQCYQVFVESPGPVRGLADTVVLPEYKLCWEADIIFNSILKFKILASSYVQNEGSTCHFPVLPVSAIQHG